MSLSHYDNVLVSKEVNSWLVFAMYLVHVCSLYIALLYCLLIHSDWLPLSHSLSFFLEPFLVLFEHLIVWFSLFLSQLFIHIECSAFAIFHSRDPSNTVTFSSPNGKDLHRCLHSVHVHVAEPFSLCTCLMKQYTSLLHGLVQVESGLALIRIQPRLSVYMVTCYYSVS